MKELSEIVAAWETTCQEDREALLATVVRVSGSTYRRPGARMLMTPEGHLAGSVSGGCLEGDILKKAWWRTQDGPALVTYDSTDADDDVIWGFGLGCNGIVQVLLERVSSHQPGPLRLLSEVLKQRRLGLVATVIGANGPVARLGDRFLCFPDGTAETGVADADLASRLQADTAALFADGTSRTQTYESPGGSADISWEIVRPPMPLVIFGAGHDALPLVRLAKELGWHVTVVDTRSPQAHPERFALADAVLTRSPDAAKDIGLDARTAAVVMTHNYSDDRRVLQTLLASHVAYIGQLGPRARTERLLAEIADNGFPITESHISRLHGPVGLDLGADNPEEIGLSIIAEIQAFRAGRTGGPLRGRREPLHHHIADTVFEGDRRNGGIGVLAVGLLILAAGASRRLGSPKQLLHDGEGRTLIRRAAETALASSCRPVAVVLGASVEAIRPELDSLRLTIVHNPDWDLGMASSLRAGLAALTAGPPIDAVVVTLCDQPKVSPALLDSLVTAHQASRHALVACEYGGTLGVPALFGRSLFGALNRLTGDEGARSVIKAYQGPITRLPFPDGQFDIDTSADFEALVHSRNPHV